MDGSFRRIAIVNRGEAAVRAIRAIQELHREERGDLRAIALYTDPDRRALSVREADEAVGLGSATFVDPADGRRKSRYLDYATLERALGEARAEAAWVGWGFVAEHAAFAELCRRLGVVFIGPDPETMRSLGDKIGSKRLAEAAGVPVAPWSGGAVDTLDDARRHAERLGFPLMVKATAGGGGRGIRRVRGPDELAEAFESARSEALAGFGDATVFMERLLEGARHVEVQIVGDGQGTTWALGVRDCTVQRRNQKVIEESPSPALSPAQHAELCDAAARLGARAGYRNAGTVEFLYDPRTQRFSFMEVNARLQVEHPVTELTTGVDLVKLQIHVARGGRLEGAPPAPRGHAIEVRVCAEDPERGFAPAPGRIELLRLPGGPGVRVDTGFRAGDRVAPEFDSMLAKVIALGRDRVEALARLERALREMQLAVRGGASNKGFLLALLARPEVRSGEVDVGWLDRLSAAGEHLPRRRADVALVQGAIDACDAELARERSQFQATAARGRLQVGRDVGVDVELRMRGARHALRVFRTGPRQYRIVADGRRIDAAIERLGPLERRLRVGGRSHHVLTLADGLDHLVEVDGIPHRLSRDDAGMVRSPAPAVVVSLAVAPGDRVAEGDRLAVLEAMKSEIPVLAPCAGVVRELLVGTNVQVESGQPLLALEPEGARGAATDGGQPTSLDALDDDGDEEADPEARCIRRLDALRRQILGFDAEPGEAGRGLDGWRALCTALPPDHPELLRREDELLAVFADVCALFEHRTADWDAAARERRTPEEYLLLYLRTLDPRAAGLSPAFEERLRRALAHYGIEELVRTPELEECLFWIARAHQRLDAHASIALGILERRLDPRVALADETGERFRELLDRIVTGMAGRHQGVSDLAREVRWRLYDRPFFEEIRERAWRDAEGRLESAAREADPERRRGHVSALVECPQPLAPLFGLRFEAAEPALRELMLEVLTRRYYRIRELENFRASERAGRSFATADYVLDGRHVHAITTHCAWKDLPSLWRELPPLFADVPAEHDVVVDLYVGRDGPHPKADATAAELLAQLAEQRFPRRIRRVVAAVSAPGGRGMGAMQHLTFRPAADGPGFVEDRLYRGLHPMMGKRLQLWRLDNFEIERIPSVEDVYLFRGVARANPRDERLFAFVEVRDLTPVRDEYGRITHLPHLEMQYLEALAAIRLVQSRRDARRRLHWNRVTLYVWPPVELGVDELHAVARQLVPPAEGLGLQKTVVRARIPDPETGSLRDTVMQIGSPSGRDVLLTFTPPADQPIAPLSAYAQRVVRMRERGFVYPYELVKLLTPARGGARGELPPGEFQEWDLDGEGRLAPVERTPGGNTANLVVGVIRNFTAKQPEGMARVILLGDPSRELGSFAEPECRRIIAALDLAESLRVPVEWFAVSAGAKIAMDSGTENLDWTAAALRRLIEFTQAGGEVNVVVAGINVGGQSYWNAEATMLQHCRGVLIMTPEGSMVLTGKRALDYSGGVSAEDHQGIGGYERIMGVNGEAQLWARDLGDACRLLFRWYEHAYVAPGERFPRRAPTADPPGRDVREFPYADGEGLFARVGDLWSAEKNPSRTKPFEIRQVMRAVIDQDHEPLERWPDMREAESAVVWEAHVGGIPACLIGIESQAVTRLGFVSADGPDTWTPGTLFPLSSKKVARAIHSASGGRPVVVLANLSGFDGSPESLRRLQLEYGAEIGRAVVNFRGPIVFCVIGRYHGGAYVVFSRRLNEGVEAAALEGSFASVIGGAPAAAVVFSGEVDRRARADARLQALDAEIAAADESARGRLRARWHELYEAVHSEKLGEVAEEFDRVHDVHRAQRVGSLDVILPPARLRPWLIEALERGLRRAGGA
jgi:acetyl/propionyl-CoA carboxylase alpha subunit/acetyl-CoA carboxylase carboxyltransferase component